jgi:tetratricopeptide (TPR) repeat protein
MDPKRMSDSNGTASPSTDRLGRLQALLLADPDNQRLARDCIDLALASGDYDFVLQHTQKILSGSPQDVTASFDRASALIGKRQFAQAIGVLQGIVARHPDISAASMNLGLCHYRLAQYSDALAPLEAVYAGGDRSAGLLRLLVSTCHHLGRMEKAVELVKANPQPATKDAKLAGVYAIAYLDSNLPKEAARWAAKALTLEPDSIDGLTVQATLDAARMLVVHAREKYERVAQLAPENGRAWVGLGTLALLERDFARARSLLVRGTELMPGHVGSWHVLAWAYLLSGDLDHAAQILEKSAQIERNFAETHGGLAAVAALRGDREAAERGIEVALRLDPKCVSAQFARSVLLSRAGNPDGGKQLIRDTMASLSPADGSLLSRVIEDAIRH